MSDVDYSELAMARALEDFSDRERGTVLGISFMDLEVDDNGCYNCNAPEAKLDIQFKTATSGWNYFSVESGDVYDFIHSVAGHAFNLGKENHV